MKKANTFDKAINSKNPPTRKRVSPLLRGIKGDAGYSIEFEDMLRTQFEKIKLNDDQLIFKEVEWSSILSTNEGKLFHNIKENLSFLGLRKFIIHSFGDAIAYQKTGSPHDTYNLINNLIKTKYDELIAEGVNEIYFVAHSLGGVILSNFIYDSQTSGVDIQFKKLFTFGTTIPLWTLKYKDFDNPIHLNDNQTWINMYDNDDILGYPLGNISPKYQDLVKAGKLIDIEVNSGSTATLSSALPINNNATLCGCGKYC